eukprot:4463858-Ditylum_brightwellii.AAC.1
MVGSGRVVKCYDRMMNYIGLRKVTARCHQSRTTILVMMEDGRKVKCHDLMMNYIALQKVTANSRQYRKKLVLESGKADS